MSFKNVFHVKDNVFAKIKDYPAWPAKIISIDTENSPKPRYVVKLYGINKYEECLPTCIFSYEENKLQFGNPRKLSKYKHKYFIKAIKEVENNCESSVQFKDNTHVINTSSNIKQKLNSEIKRKKSTQNLSPVKDLNAIKKKKLISKKTKRKLSVTELKTFPEKILDKKVKLLDIVKGIKIEPLVVLSKFSNSLFEKFICEQSLNTTDKNVTANEQICYTNNKDLDSFNTTTPVLEPNDDLLYSKTIKSISKIKDKSNLRNEEQKEFYNNNLDVGLISQRNCIVNIKQISTDENKTRKLLKLRKAPKIGNLSLENEYKAQISNGAKLPNKKYSVPLLESDTTKKTNCISLGKNGTLQEHFIDVNDKVPRKCFKSSIRNLKNHNLDNKNKDCIKKYSNDEKSLKITKYLLSKETNFDITKNLIKKLDNSPLETHDCTTTSNLFSNLETSSNQTDIGDMSDKIINENKQPIALQGLKTDAVLKIEMENMASKEDYYLNLKTKISLLQKEVDLLDSLYNLRSALSLVCPNFNLAIDALKQITKFNFNTLILKKHQSIVQTILEVCKYVGNIDEQKVSKKEVYAHNKMASQIRNMARRILDKIILLFNAPDIQSFIHAYNKEKYEFWIKFSHLSLETIYGCISEDQLYK